MTLRRHVALDRTDDYLLAWASLQRVVETLGARAWLFSGAEHEDQFLEFIEWSDAADPQDSPLVAEALEQLAAFAPATAVEEWEQAQ